MLRFGSSHGTARLVDGGGSLALELGAKFGLFEQLRVLAHMTACTKCIASSLLEFHIFPIVLAAAVAWKKRLNMPSSLPVLGPRQGEDGSHRTQAAHAARRWLRREQRLSSVSG